MIKAIIFDCFGVLLNDGLTSIVIELEKVNSQKADEIRTIIGAATAGGIGAEDARTRVATILGLTVEEYKEKIKQTEVKNQRVLDLAASLRPRYKTAVLSNILAGGLTVRFPKNEAAKYFDCMIASGEIGYAKPDPKAYTITAKRLGIQPKECVMIDDRQEYVDGALAVGMQAILYTSLPDLQAELKELLV